MDQLIFYLEKAVQLGRTMQRNRGRYLYICYYITWFKHRPILLICFFITRGLFEKFHC